MNPLKSFILSHMDTPEAADAKFVDRIAEGSVNAQKMVDERRSHYRTHEFWKRERRARENDHFFVAHSALKTSEGGYRSSRTSMKYYEDKTAKRREELLEKYGNEEEPKEESA